MSNINYYSSNPYTVLTGKNGAKCIDPETVRTDLFHVSRGNAKTGPVMNVSFPVEFTCRHDCECYKMKQCYACNGFYQMSSVQLSYAENLAFWRHHTPAEFVARIQSEIDRSRSDLFRFFCAGDFPDLAFVATSVQIAKDNPGVRFWTYTKKYRLVNEYVRIHGVEAIPENFVILFSEWRNSDGSIMNMDNPYSFPVARFIPLGSEDLEKTCTTICPCSDPESLEHCATCKTPCYKLKSGDVMGLKEHSTARTRDRDRTIKKAKAAKAASLESVTA